MSDLGITLLVHVVLILSVLFALWVGWMRDGSINQRLNLHCRIIQELQTGLDDAFSQIRHLQEQLDRDYEISDSECEDWSDDEYEDDLYPKEES